MRRKPLGRTGLQLTGRGAAWPAGSGPPVPPDDCNWCRLPADTSAAAWSTVRDLLAPDAVVIGVIDPTAWDHRMSDACSRLLGVTGRSRLDVWELGAFDLERIKAGEPFRRAIQLRDAGRIRFLGLCVRSIADALWAIDHTPAHVLTVDAPLDDPAWSELGNAAAESGVGLLATAAAVGGDPGLASRLIKDTMLTGVAWPFATND